MNRSGREGERVPLSEEEQRILHEMEQKLLEHDRAFVDRVRRDPAGSHAGRGLRWSVVFFLCGFVLLILTFRDSLLLGTLGFVIMLFSALMFERHVRRVDGPFLGLSRTLQNHGIGDELSEIHRRLRSKFKHDE
jgi:hypothetical protein